MFNIYNKAQANLHSGDAQEIYQLDSFSQSLHATQSFIDGCTSDSDSGVPFLICQE